MDLDQYRELARVIKTTVDIASVIAEHTPVRAHGKESAACCPFHNDKTPSMTINSAKGLYHCKGCGASGDVIKLQSEISGTSMGEAIVTLARKYNIPLPKPTEKAKGDYTRRDLEALASVAKDYHEQLGTPEGGAALVELRRRGVSEPTIKRFNLGYGGLQGEKPKSLIGNDDKSRFIHAKTAGRTGIYSERQWHYMTDRIVFPIRDEHGTTRGFGGRKIEQTERGDDDMPKYLNTPETAYFKKGNLLYGAFEAREAIRQTRQAILVEGYMDVVLVHQEGFENTVGAMTATIDDAVLARLWRNVDDLVICLDGDPAGLRGTMRIIESAAKSYTDGKAIRVALLPDGMDPDEYVLTKGREAFAKLITEAIPASNFVVRYHAKSCDMATAEGRGGFIGQVNAVADKFENAPNFAAQLKSQAQLHSDLRAFATVMSGALDEPIDNNRALCELSAFKDRIQKILDQSSQNVADELPRGGIQCLPRKNSI